MAKSVTADAGSSLEAKPNPVAERHDALRRIDAQFRIGDSVNTLQRLMTDVTSKELTADTVNAACNCVSQINSTLKTTIAAAKFLSDR